MRAYAAETSVPVERSEAEIKRLLLASGASKFLSGQTETQAFIEFELADRRIRFVLPLPALAEFEFGSRKNCYGKPIPKKRTPIQQRAAWEQSCRQRWRGLLLAIKAKLESARSGIETLDEAFLAQIVIRGGGTVGHLLLPQLGAAAETGKLPPLLGAGGSR